MMTNCSASSLRPFCLLLSLLALVSTVTAVSCPETYDYPTPEISCGSVDDTVYDDLLRLYGDRLPDKSLLCGVSRTSVVELSASVAKTAATIADESCGMDVALSFFVGSSFLLPGEESPASYEGIDADLKDAEVGARGTTTYVSPITPSNDKAVLLTVIPTMSSLDSFYKPVHADPVYFIAYDQLTAFSRETPSAGSISLYVSVEEANLADEVTGALSQSKPTSIDAAVVIMACLFAILAVVLLIRILFALRLLSVSKRRLRSKITDKVSSNESILTSFSFKLRTPFGRLFRTPPHPNLSEPVEPVAIETGKPAGTGVVVEEVKGKIELPEVAPTPTASFIDDDEFDMIE